MNRKILLPSMALLLGALLAGCAVQQEPLLTQVGQTPLQKVGFEQQGKPAKSCGSSLFGCPQPLYEVAFAAPANLEASNVCSAFVDTAFKLGNPNGFGPDGQAAGPIPKDRSSMKTFCTESLGTERLSVDKSFKYYEGFMIVDSGAKDQLGKNFILRRDETGKYQAIVAFCRDLPRISWVVNNEAPKHSYN